MVGPNLEVFVNGVPGTVETNGTKLDRAQVFGLPEVEYVAVGPDGGGGGGDGEDGMEEGEHGVDAADGTRIFVTADQEGFATPKPVRGSIHGIDSSLHENVDTTDHSALSTSGKSLSSSNAPAIPITPSEESRSSGNGQSSPYVSSSCCSICLDEFVPRELVRVLPRCNHAFHTECILPWLTERQGCCPMCKVPVLPEELQRGGRQRGLRRSRRSDGASDRAGSSSRRFRRGGTGVGSSLRRSTQGAHNESSSAASSPAAGDDGPGAGGQGRDRPPPFATPSAAPPSVEWGGEDSADLAAAGAGALRNDEDEDLSDRSIGEAEGESDIAVVGGALSSPLPRVVTPDGSPRSPSVPSGASVPLGSSEDGADEGDELRSPTYRHLDDGDFTVPE